MAHWCVLGSGIHGEAKAALRRFAAATGCRLAESWAPGATHVVCALDGTGRAKRTVKYLAGIAAGAAVVDSRWMADCLKAGRPVAEGG